MDYEAVWILATHSHAVASCGGGEVFIRHTLVAHSLLSKAMVASFKSATKQLLWLPWQATVYGVAAGGPQPNTLYISTTRRY